jgi:hypothetical protein
VGPIRQWLTYFIPLPRRAQPHHLSQHLSPPDSTPRSLERSHISRGLVRRRARAPARQPCGGGAGDWSSRSTALSSPSSRWTCTAAANHELQPQAAVSVAVGAQALCDMSDGICLGWHQPRHRGLGGSGRPTWLELKLQSSASGSSDTTLLWSFLCGIQWIQ